MNNEILIELTKELIFQATHFNVPYVKQVYANNLLIVKVEKNGVVGTMNKEQLVGFVQSNSDANVKPFYQSRISLCCLRRKYGYGSDDPRFRIKWKIRS